MELKIYSPTDDGFVQAIEWNHEEIKKEVAEKVAYYKNLVYTDEQIKDAKSDRARLNKFLTALEDKRKEIKKQCLAPYESFEKQMKEITSIVQESVAAIGTQISGYEEKQKQDKLAKIQDYYNGIEKPELHWLGLPAIYSEKWLNTSVSMKSIQEEINARLEQVEKDLATLSDLPEFGFEAAEVYKTTLDLNKAISEAKRMSEIAKAKAAREAEQARLAAEAEAKKQAEQIAEQTGEAVFNDAPDIYSQKPKIEKEWVAFACLLTVEDAQALGQFFNSRGIAFKQVDYKEGE